MSFTSRSGLLPSQKPNINTLPLKKLNTELPKELEVTSIALTLRPFSGLYNPYAKGCSVLCNHPAPSAVREVINQVRTTLATESKYNLQHAKEKLDILQNCNLQHNGNDNIPDDLFRRYTDTDSRPLTPSPTVTSIYTLTSSLLNNRRCITPELGKAEISKRKKIILDLRRSHSQETLYWKPSSDVSQSFKVNASVATAVDRMHTKSAGANEERKIKAQKSIEGRPKSSVGRILSEMHVGADLTPAQTVNNNDDQDFNEGVLRRSRRRKKNRPMNVQTTAFHPREDPETQVATLGPDSLNPSTRPSLIPNGSSLLPSQEKPENDMSELLKGSFLTKDAFRALKKELDVDTIENTFGRYLNCALREAIKYLPRKPAKLFTGETDKESEKLAPSIFVPSGKMPRKLSKSATRFEVPLDLRTLEKMNVLEYLGNYVWVSRQRKQLYKRVFVKYLTQQMRTLEYVVGEDSTEKPFEYIERTMSVRHLPTALEDVLEFYGTEKNISAVISLLDYQNLEHTELDFRTWCGIVSFAERFVQHESNNNTDSCDELEKADFNSMTQRLEYFPVSKNLSEVFQIIRSMHFLPFERESK